MSVVRSALVIQVSSPIHHERTIVVRECTLGTYRVHDQLALTADFCGELRFSQIAFSCDALVRFVHVFDAIFECDTSTLAPNIRDEKSLPELAALERLRVLYQEGKCTLLRSHIVRGELERTPDVALRKQLKEDFDLLDGILHDEKLLGFNTMYDQYGGFTTNPLISDIQDSQIFEEIYQEIKRRVPGAPDFQVRRDAEHLAQAIFNGCDVFLTRDYKTIIGPMCEWLEQKYPPLRIMRPSELLAEIDQRPPDAPAGPTEEGPRRSHPLV